MEWFHRVVSLTKDDPELSINLQKSVGLKIHTIQTSEEVACNE
jgi:hypothetical protein